MVVTSTGSTVMYCKIYAVVQANMSSALRPGENHSSIENNTKIKVIEASCLLMHYNKDFNGLYNFLVVLEDLRLKSGESFIVRNRIPAFFALV